jgi:hypothetical protein
MLDEATYSQHSSVVVVDPELCALDARSDLFEASDDWIQDN